MQVFVRGDCTMIAAPVQCDVDGVPKGSHFARVPPRVHPVSARIREGRLFVRMDLASPKAKDLLRDGRYAMHSQVLDTSGRGGEFAISGTARLVDDSAAVEKLERGLPDPGRYVVFEFDIEQASSTVYEGGQAVRRKWGGRA